MRKYLASMPSPRRGAAIGTTPSELGIMKGAGLALRSSGLGFAIVCRVRLRDPTSAAVMNHSFQPFLCHLSEVSPKQYPYVSSHFRASIPKALYVRWCDIDRRWDRSTVLAHLGLCPASFARRTSLLSNIVRTGTEEVPHALIPLPPGPRRSRVPDALLAYRPPPFVVSARPCALAARQNIAHEMRRNGAHGDLVRERTNQEKREMIAVPLGIPREVNQLSTKHNLAFWPRGRVWRIGPFPFIHMYFYHLSSGLPPKSPLPSLLFSSPRCLVQIKRSRRPRCALVILHVLHPSALLNGEVRR